MKRLGLIALSLILVGAGCFSGSSSTTGDGGVFQTYNSGEDWEQTVLVPTAAGVGTLATTDVLNMEMDPQDDSFLYIGTRQNGMLYSEDAGISWRQPRYDAMTDGTIFSVEVSPKDVCTLYVAKGSRLYKSTDCMRSFDNEVYVENRSGVSVVQIAVDWYDTKTVWIGLNNGDVLKSTDGGNSWRTVLKAGDEVSEIMISNTDSRKIIVSTFSDGMQRTTDGGETWDEVDGGLSDLKRADHVYALTQSADAGVVLAATEYGLVSSDDFGQNWTALNLVTSPGEVLIRALGMDAENPNRIYYAANGTFYRSTDGGNTWETERLATSRIIRAMLVDPEDSSVLYIGAATNID